MARVRTSNVEKRLDDDCRIRDGSINWNHDEVLGVPLLKELGFVVSPEDLDRAENIAEFHGKRFAMHLSYVVGRSAGKRSCASFWMKRPVQRNSSEYIKQIVLSGRSSPKRFASRRLDLSPREIASPAQRIDSCFEPRMISKEDSAFPTPMLRRERGATFSMVPHLTFTDLCSFTFINGRLLLPHHRDTPNRNQQPLRQRDLHRHPSRWLLRKKLRE